jgi:hypothetical protein
MLIPGFLEQRFGADHVAPGTHEQFKDRELFSAQFQIAPVPVHLVSKWIEAQIGELENGANGCGWPSGERAQANNKLLEGERLGEIVIGSEFKSPDFVGEPGCRGQHQNAHDRMLARYDPANFIARDSRNIPIQDDHVVVVRGNTLKRDVAIERHIGGDRIVTQTGLDRFRQKPFIFDYENPHIDPYRPFLTSPQRSLCHVAKVLRKSLTPAQHPNA